MEESELVYRSRVQIHQKAGKLREAHLPAEDHPIFFGNHAEIAEHYEVDPTPEETRAATLDYFVASAAG